MSILERDVYTREMSNQRDVCTNLRDICVREMFVLI